MKIPNIFTKKYNIPEKYNILVIFTKYERIYEKILIYIILIYFGVHIVAFNFAFPSVIIMKLFQGGFLLSYLLGQSIMREILGFGALLLGVILLFILYCEIDRSIFFKYHKIRKILLLSFILYLIICEIAMAMGFGPH